MWYEDAEGTTPGSVGEWWWAVEHRGHPAFYLRALISGDFAPGSLVDPRHVAPLSLDETTDVPSPVRCGTCDEVPDTDDLEPIERVTGNRGYLREFREGRKPWGRRTLPATCWLCSDSKVKASEKRDVKRGARRPKKKKETDPPAVKARAVSVCARCAAHLDREARREETT